METTTVRVAGIQTPAYLNGRSREMLVAAFRQPAPEVTAAPMNFVTALRGYGTRSGEGVPFAALYMTRAKKKLALVAA